MSIQPSPSSCFLIHQRKAPPVTTRSRTGKAVPLTTPPLPVQRMDADKLKIYNNFQQIYNKFKQ